MLATPTPRRPRAIRKHDLAVFHLLDPLELGFTFHRPMRFYALEGGPPIFAEPNEIAERYHDVELVVAIEVADGRPIGESEAAGVEGVRREVPGAVAQEHGQLALG